MFYATACYLYTPNPEKSYALLTEILGFAALQEDNRTSVCNGSLTLHLARGKYPAMLTLQCSSIENDAQSLMQQPNIHQRTNITRYQNTLEQHLYCDEGITLILSQPLSEDDTGELPPLPITLVWQDELVTQAQHILKATPLAFREKARINMTQQAEYLAIEAGELEVQQPHIMQAFVAITPPFQHQTLYEAMKTQGIDADSFLDPTTWQDDACSQD
ncbi:MAG: DUF2621 family protein [Ghiorsea sp.]|nr:DUF2621 family protein [Ghiorsea sp.]